MSTDLTPLELLPSDGRVREEQRREAVATAGLAHDSGTVVSKHDFPPRRELIRRRAVTVALLELSQYLKGLSIP